MKIGFIGNFIPQHSTENDRKWSFEQLGHQVITFQENETTSFELIQEAPNLDVLFYSHTHDPSYVIEGLREVFDFYKAKLIPTVSVHLDRWIGLQRVRDMGKEATWFTEYIFMADGSLEAGREYTRLGLNWYFLRPGVVDRECHMVEPNYQKFPHKIVFVGSMGYHPEYPWRPELIRWLHKTYGDSFAHYGNDGLRVVRGTELNELYASAKIAVGDSCFGGRPYYVSDRYFETRGRGGFLLHPKVEGFDNVGIGNYEHGSFDDLKRVIDYYLEQEDERESMRKRGFSHVKNIETYTHRAKEMLDIIFGGK